VTSRSFCSKPLPTMSMTGASAGRDHRVVQSVDCGSPQRRCRSERTRARSLRWAANTASCQLPGVGPGRMGADGELRCGGRLDRRWRCGPVPCRGSADRWPRGARVDRCGGGRPCRSRHIPDRPSQRVSARHTRSCLASNLHVRQAQPGCHSGLRRTPGGGTDLRPGIHPVVDMSVSGPDSPPGHEIRVRTTQVP
jgi:hypothetical protein